MAIFGPPPGGSKRAMAGVQTPEFFRFFAPLRCSAQGGWGGSAHYPDPTAQSVDRVDAAPRATHSTGSGRLGRRRRGWRGRLAGGFQGPAGLARSAAPSSQDCRRCLSGRLRPGSGTLRASSPRSTLRCPPPRILADGRGKAPRAPDDRAALDFYALPSSTSRRLLASTTSAVSSTTSAARCLIAS